MPVSGKERRRLIKATVWRLARILRIRSVEVLSAPTLTPALDRAFPRRASGRGEACRLIAKLDRLRTMKK